ncbi:MAG TPA: recombinase XerD, partial [Rhodobacteraceae bacterium]|nr:recombinase XerD [Paracoccaceae bacterium]
MQNWIENFLETIFAEQNASDNTIKAYAADLSEFYGYL